MTMLSPGAYSPVNLLVNDRATLVAVIPLSNLSSILSITLFSTLFLVNMFFRCNLNSSVGFPFIKYVGAIFPILAVRNSPCIEANLSELPYFT